MSRKYKFHNPEGIYFVSFATVYWLDIFIREIYMEELIQSLSFCIKTKGMRLFAWCVMPSHIHLIFKAKENNPSELLKAFKTFTSKRIQELIINNNRESRKEWLLWMMERAASKNSNVKNRQFWQQHNKPIELWSNEVKDQKLQYVHHNPVEAGFVSEPEHWKYSSAIDYAGGKGLVNIEPL
jgi:REP element-mobilizing transposase RayT